MKFRRVVALLTSLACVAAVEPGVLATAASVSVSNAQQVPVTATAGQGISGTVFRSDGKTPVPNQPVQLRNLDKNIVVAKSVTDKNGAFSFSVTEPGLYIVEAINKDGGVVAIGNPVTLLTLPIITSVILPSSVKLLAWVLVGVASGAGVVGWVAATEGPISPER
jgi:hypothetical protein